MTKTNKLCLSVEDPLLVHHNQPPLLRMVMADWDPHHASEPLQSIPNLKLGLPFNVPCQSMSPRRKEKMVTLRDQILDQAEVVVVLVVLDQLVHAAAVEEVLVEEEDHVEVKEVGVDVVAEEEGGVKEDGEAEVHHPSQHQRRVR